MRLHRFSLLSMAVGLGVGLIWPATAASAAPVPNQILSVTPVCQTGGLLQVTVQFSHTGRAEVRIYSVAGGTNRDSAAAWFSGTGTDTWTGSVFGDSAVLGGSVSVQAHILRHGPHGSLVDSAPVFTVSAGACPST